MLFNSVDFFLFFLVVLTQYFRAPWWLRWPAALVGVAFPLVRAPSLETGAAALFTAVCLALVVALRARGEESRARKVLLLTASLLFYSAWRWPFVSLLLFSTFLDHNCALAIHRARSQARRRFFLTLSLIGNLGVLAVFKYTNLILQTIEDALGITGLQVTLGPLSIILPLGISFYTFQTLSYTIDVYRGTLEPRESILDVALFVSFFPQLVAGPIVRASTFLPQLERNPEWDAYRAKSGMLLMLWGLGKKLLIADALAPIVNQAYGNPDVYSGLALVMATYAFAFQVYCDFSGYSDVAIGAARVLGFDLPLNFNYPYFATNITTLWRRWHISLSTWLRDYLYISLGGSRCSRARILFNLMATMVLGGLWHGASYNFVIWGAIHGVALAGHKAYLWARGEDRASDDTRPLHWIVKVIFTFHLWCFTLVFFRAETLGKAVSILSRVGEWSTGLMVPLLFPLVLIPFLLLADSIQVRTSVSEALLRYPRLSRMVLYAGVLLMLAVVTANKPVDFIYFVF